jgi:hypothetical protein
MTDYDEQSFKFLTENSADMIFRCDFTPKFTCVSSSSVRLLGKAPEEFPGAPHLAFEMWDIRTASLKLRNRARR